MDFDLSNLGSLLGGFQQKMQEMKEKAAAARCRGEAGGGLVKVELTGAYDVVSVSIAEGAFEDRELCEDLVRAAFAEAVREVRATTERNLRDLTGGLPLPPGLLPF
jgi:DNA-binding YbaB/EbfC family protein